MKNISPFFILLILTSFFSYSQTYKIESSSFDDLIFQVYGENAQKVIYNDPKVLYLYKSVLDRIEIIKTQNVGENYTFLSSIPAYKNLNENNDFKPDTFNPFNYKFDIFRKDKTVYYKVDNTDYLISIKPLK